MSFHSALVAAWPADLVTAGVVSVAAAVYVGRRPQGVPRQDAEVWLERVGVEERGGGLQRVHAHQYLAHVRGGPTNAGGKRTGEAQVTAVEALQRLLVARYDGTRRLYSSTGLSNLVAWAAVEERPDFDPEDQTVLDGVVRVTVLERE